MENAKRVGSVLPAEEVLNLQLQKLRSTPKGFKLPLCLDDCYKLLYGSLKVEVQRSGHALRTDSETTRVVAEVAKGLHEGCGGMLLCGVCGNGKTSMLLAMQTATEWVKRARLFETRYTTYDMDNMLFVKSKTIVRECETRLDFYKRKPLLLIDDLGEEPTEVLDYGNVNTPLVDLLEYRYSAKLFTAISTNLNGKQLREKYGVRIVDRLNEMMRVLVFKNQSFR